MLNAFEALSLATIALAAICFAYLLVHWRRRHLATLAKVRYPYQHNPAKVALVATDLMVMWLSFITQYAVLNNKGLPDTPLVLVYVAMTGACAMWFWMHLEHYSRRRPFWTELKECLEVTAGMAFVTGTLCWVLELAPSKSVLAMTLAGNVLLIPIFRAVCKFMLNRWKLWQIPTVVIGAGHNAVEAVAALQDEPSMGYNVIGVIDVENQRCTERPPCSFNGRQVQNMDLSAYSGPALHNQVEISISYLRAHQVVVAMDSLTTPAAQALLQHLMTRVRGTHVIPSLRGLPLFGTTVAHFFSHEVLLLSVRNNLSRRSYKWVKRGFDIVVSALLLLLLSPLFIVVSLAVRRSGATPFYGHPRVGQNAKRFDCYKFRSMRPDAAEVLQELLDKDPVARAEWEKDFKLKNDPRITPIGHFLRKTSLDELPQLFNVLLGDMSLVGPRPVVANELARYEDQAKLYVQVLPGITGLWQISGRNDISYAERVSLDVWYVKNWSLWYDIAILFKTASVVVKRSGAY